MDSKTTETITIDRLDRRLIHALTLDGRAPFRRIAAALGASEQTIARRYRRLREAGVVRVVVLRDPRGSHENLFIRIRTTPGGAGPIGTALARRPDVSWVMLAAAGTEVTCALRSDDPRERDELILHGLSRLGQVLDVSSATVLHAFAGDRLEEWHALDDPLDPAEIAALARRSSPARLAADRADPPPLGPADTEILRLLAIDGRTSYATLAAATGRSEGAVARRVEALIDRGTLFVDVDLAHALLGYRALATIWLTVAPTDLDRVGSEIARHPEVGFAGAVSGPSNLVAAVICRDATDLYRYITQRLGAIAAVRQHDVTVLVRQLKQAGTIMDGDRLPNPLLEP